MMVRSESLACYKDCSASGSKICSWRIFYSLGSVICICIVWLPLRWLSQSFSLWRRRTKLRSVSSLVAFRAGGAVDLRWAGSWIWSGSAGRVFTVNGGEIHGSVSEG